MAGKVYSIDNISGHFKPGVGSFGAVKLAFSKIPEDILVRIFKGIRNMIKSNYLGTNGLYPWFPECGDEYIKKEYLEVIKEISLYGKVFQCVGRDGGFLTLKYGRFFFSARHDLYTPIKPLRFQIDDKVIVVTSSAVRNGIVTDINWHYKIKEPIYYLTINGRKIPKRYLDADLQLI